MVRMIAGVVGLILIMIIGYSIYKLVMAKQEAEEEQKAIDLSEFIPYETKEGWAEKFKDWLDPKKGNHLKEAHGMTVKTASLSVARKILDAIYNAGGVFDDDETAMLTGFKMIPSLSDLKLLSALLTNEKGSWDSSHGGVIEYAQYFLDDNADLALLYDMLKKKPEFILIKKTK